MRVENQLGKRRPNSDNAWPNRPYKHCISPDPVCRVVGGTDNDWGYSLTQTTDMGFVVAGTTYSDIAVGSRSIMLSKFDSDGNHIWTATVGGTSFWD